MLVNADAVRGCIAMAICGAVTVASEPIAHSPAPVERGVHTRYAAVAFDYLVLFDPDSVRSAVERIAPGRSREFTNLWRTRHSSTAGYDRLRVATSISSLSPGMLSGISRYG